MVSITRDPLLAIAKGVLYFLMGITAFAAAVCLVAIPALFIFQNDIAGELARDAPGLAMPQLLTALGLVLLLVIGLMAALFRIFLLLRRIVDTVGQGDPFVPENARRLTQMAWLSLGVQLISLPIGAIGLWIARATEGTDTNVDVHVDGGLSGNGLLLMLILFILARVFRQGAAMRAELEGTV
ncbi:DUF2975 domain-containing protein [Novosphingobium album (ex Liu et al. 2023)]|uniref:DUF2975 domain-containing protein n=1 Tax=Novosphingobium album (ex Liu et al. 2023) TaxID=3031130 RepID=A0ABT5WLZ8_9SPHN|nr:DUF2975 domain-containing protein [Novosphingobium album (ex Liu et al. 2023)]MDE8651067.1 DUF2975 domain-containing protein [Novosphingobium album (ex Liu et al. 2023)]